MTKVKEKLYEHRFGLFFFGFLMVYSFVVTGEILWKTTAGITKSIYAVDFTFGFRTKLLPGAIYNLLSDNFSDEAISLYVQIIFIACISGIAFFSEKIIKSFEKDKYSDATGIVIIGATAFTVICFEAGFIALMDLHWIVAFIFFFLFLQNKKTYILLPVAFLYAIMSHFASVICYVPLFILIVLYKILDTDEKKEKLFLSIIFTVSTVLSVGIALYMIIFESEGMKYTLSQFHEKLMLKGVDEFFYYDSAFYRDVAAEFYQQAILENENIIKIDHTQNSLIVFLQTLIQRVQIHLSISEHKEYLIKYIIHLPAVVFVVNNLYSFIKKTETRKLKKLIILMSPMLYIAIIVVGFLLSTDTARWFGHATIALFTLFLYFIYREESFRDLTLAKIKKIPQDVIFVYILLYISAPFVV